MDTIFDTTWNTFRGLDGMLTINHIIIGGSLELPSGSLSGVYFKNTPVQNGTVHGQL